MLSRDPSDRLEVTSLWNWVQSGGLTIDLALQIDPLSVLMMLVITGVGSLILLYSTEYMEHDRDYRRFFAEMSFFVFSMLLLVEAANFLFLIVGWAFVGLASYLLIGYYYQRPTAVAAAKKAFVINVIGDVGMVLAAFLLVRELGTLELPGRVRRGAPGPGRRHPAWPRPWRCCCSWGRPPRARRSRSTPGCPTPWRAPPRSAR